MKLPTTGGSPFTARVAIAAATIFAAASITTNAWYGWSRGADLPSSVVWAGVSIAAGLTQVLSWPALVTTIDRRQWGKALAALCALLLCGSYSVIAALGSASGGRINAAIEERASSEQRSRAQAAYEQARAALAQLAPSRPLAEVEALLVVAKPTCRNTMLNGKRDLFCVPNAVLVAEKARAVRRAELQTQMERANAVLSEAPTHVANADARALQRYLGAAGVRVEADRLNDLLTLLAVLVIECAGGLALVIALTLSERSMNTQAVHSGPDHSTEGQTPERPAAPKEQVSVHTVHSLPKSSRDRLLEMVRDAQGVLRTGHRALGEALGVSATRVGQLLKDLSADGVIRVRAGKTGSAITLAPRMISQDA
jgi:hypothetical protein